MKTITLKVGAVRAFKDGFQQDERRPVEFVGKLLYSITTRTGDDDTRGITETLYRTEDDRLVVYVEDWSRWQGEPSHYSLYQVTEADLQVGGQYEDLGREAGFGRPLTLDEVLG